ncbi:MAG: HK97 family phage prohead protease [Erysipelotrichaceae bacterium]
MNPKTELISRAYTSEFSIQANTITGLAAVYDSRTNIGNFFYEIIERGAFDETDLTDVLFFVNHDLSKIPLARSRRNNGNSSMTLKVDERGLNIETNLDVENNADARSLTSAIKRGDITGMSFLFSVKEDAWEELNAKIPTRRIKKIARVREVSAVNFPAYDATEISARESRSLDSDLKALENARAVLDKTKEESEILKLKNRCIQMKVKG